MHEPAPIRLSLRCPTCRRSVVQFEHERRKIVRCKVCREPLESKGVTIGPLSGDEAKAIEHGTTSDPEIEIRTTHRNRSGVAA